MINNHPDTDDGAPIVLPTDHPDYDEAARQETERMDDCTMLCDSSSISGPIQQVWDHCVGFSTELPATNVRHTFPITHVGLDNGNRMIAIGGSWVTLDSVRASHVVWENLRKWTAGIPTWGKW